MPISLTTASDFIFSVALWLTGADLPPVTLLDVKENGIAMRLYLVGKSSV